jgi:thiamine phosphate synthase YjbQ (UPF0047 family)
MKLKVLVKFQDINNKSIYNVDDVIDVPSNERAESLVKRGLCEVPVEEKSKTIKINDVDYELDLVKEALKSIEKGVPGNAGEKAVNSKIAELTDEEIQAIVEFLQK